MTLADIVLKEPKTRLMNISRRLVVSQRNKSFTERNEMSSN